MSCRNTFLHPTFPALVFLSHFIYNRTSERDVSEAELRKHLLKERLSERTGDRKGVMKHCLPRDKSSALDCYVLYTLLMALPRTGHRNTDGGNNRSPHLLRTYIVIGPVLAAPFTHVLTPSQNNAVRIILIRFNHFPAREPGAQAWESLS